ncbi:MAG TPA: GNAT family N-acetyltransferase [Opitutaceae bacterium]|nr:GNAT family N-acetyltransferase [Opitutaceae bacterium]
MPQNTATPAAVSIRPATAADLPAVLALYAQPEIDNGHVLPLDRAEAVFRQMQSYPRYTLYVASAGSRIVGTFSLLIAENLAHFGAPSGVVEDVVVAVEEQGKGIGKQMMRYALDRCREHGCYKMALSSNARRTPAHRFYDSLGFKRHGLSFVATPVPPDGSPTGPLSP